MTAQQDIIDQLGNLDPTQLAAVGSIIASMDATGFGSSEVYPQRIANDPLFAEQYGAEPGDDYIYTGAGYVDADGKILVERDLNGNPVLDTNNEPVVVQLNASTAGSQQYFDLASRNPEGLDLTLALLESSGFNVGTVQQQVSAFQRVQQYAIDMGVTWEVAMDRIRLYGPKEDAKAQKIPIVRVSNPEDLKVVANRTALSTLGRELTEDEATRFVASYQQMQRTPETQMVDGMQQVTQTAAADVAAESFAREQAPTEAAAYDGMQRVGWLIDSVRSIV